MPELIDRAKLLEYLAAIKPDEYVSAYGEAAVDVINHVETYVSEMPTIEAEPVRKPEMSEADRKKCEEWCKDCEHIEMCKWYPFGGCDFRLLPKPEQPTIEPEVRHGRWNRTGVSNVFGGEEVECSECGFKVILSPEHIKNITEYERFCCHCGARMDGGADNG